MPAQDFICGGFYECFYSSNRHDLEGRHLSTRNDAAVRLSIFLCLMASSIK
jgi:hypothetical protein